MTLDAEDVSLNVLHIVNIRNMKASWHVDASDVKSLDGGEWLKVWPKSHTLVKVIMLDNEHMGAGSSGSVYNQTLYTSIGLANLKKLRNQQQSEDLIAHANAFHDGSCTLFGTSNKRPRINFNKHSQQLNAHEGASMVLEPEPGKAIKVLRPYSSLESIWVSKDPASIANMINYIRSEGFDSELVNSKLPKGIQRRSQKFVVKYIKEDGSDGWKTLSTLEAAVAYQEKKETPAQCDAGEPVEAEDESDSEEPVEAEDERDSEELVEAEDERAADEPVEAA